MEKVNFYLKSIRAAFLVAGTTIGAGMLGIPLVTAQIGFAPAMLITVAVWAFMLATGLLLLEATLKLPLGANFLSISEHYLGKVGKQITGGLFIFLYYSLMVAYIAAGGDLFVYFTNYLFGGMMPPYLGVALFTLIFGTILAKTPRFVESVNFFLVIGMGVFWVALFSFGAPQIRAERLLFADYRWMFLSLPILFGSFGFHNVVPSLVTYLQKDVKALRFAIIGGTAIALAVYVVWQYLILGVLPRSAIASAMAMGMPVTAALQKAVASSAVIVLGQTFALFAMVTSVLGVSLSMVDFLDDTFLRRGKKVARSSLAALTFGPPLACTLINPALFEKALSVAGGLGESLINGLIPILMVWSLRFWRKDRGVEQLGYGKPMLLFLIAFSIFAFAVEAVHLLW